jgi:hypothetical protein
MRNPHWREVSRLIQIPVPEYLHPIFDFLESEGLRFCVDFGTENARRVARNHWDAVKHTRTIH